MSFGFPVIVLIIGWLVGNGTVNFLFPCNLHKKHNMLDTGNGTVAPEPVLIYCACPNRGFSSKGHRFNFY
jgi:hypothetical protein